MKESIRDVFLRLMGFKYHAQIKKGGSNGSLVLIGRDSLIRMVKESIRDVYGVRWGSSTMHKSKREDRTDLRFQSVEIHPFEG